MEEEEEAAGQHRPSDGSAAVEAPRVSSGGCSDEGDFFDTQQRGRDADQEDDDGGMRAGGGYRASDIAGRFIQAVGDAKVHVDTAATIDSVRGAVSKFGGALDWRERRQQAQDELEKMQGEAAEYQRRLREAEADKAQALRELGGVTGDIDDLWLTVKRAQIAQAQVRKDSELAKLRLRKTEKGARERAAAKEELDAVRGHHATAVADLRSVRAETEALRKERAAEADEADAVTARARETVASSREAGEAVEEVAAELRALREELVSSRAAHDAAEETRMRAALALQQDKVRWQAELEQADEEARKLRDELAASSDLHSRVTAASELLVSLRAELFALTASTHATRKGLDEVKANVDRAKDEAKILRVVAASLRADLVKEKAELAAVRRKEAASSASIPPLEEELNRLASELASAEARAKELGGGGKAPPTEQLTEARREAERATASARSAREEAGRAREEATAAKVAARATEARLEALTREVLAAKASEEIATASADALLQESADAPARGAPQQSQAIVEGGVALTEEEYGELSRCARETEEAAGRRVIEAVKLVKEAKDAEARSLEKLAQLTRQTEQRRQTLGAATKEAEQTEQRNLAAERELRRCQWSEQQRRTSITTTAAAEAKQHKKKKKTSFFPRMASFLGRKRAPSSSSHGDLTLPSS